MFREIRMHRFLIPAILVLLAWCGGFAASGQPTLKIGIVGCDTSHCEAFTKIFNNPQNQGDLANMKVVAAYPGGSLDLPDSVNRVPGYVKQLREEFGVEIVATIPALLEKVDVVLLESVDGRPHWQQVQPVLRAKKPVFIDKPLAGTLADAIRIADLVHETGTPCFSSSGLRFTPNIAGARENPKIGAIYGCLAYSPCHLEPHHPDLFWYGIHGVETLYTIMGPGCRSVQRSSGSDADVVTGTWNDGRIATFRGIRKGKADFGALVFGEKGVVATGSFTGYDPLVTAIARFFRSGKAPVALEESLEILAFMQAADESKAKNGQPILLEDVMSKAKQEARGK
jgi:predicted dehydrogenase